MDKRLYVLCNREFDIESPDITILMDGNRRKTIRDGEGNVQPSQQSK